MQKWSPNRFVDVVPTHDAIQTEHFDRPLGLPCSSHYIITVSYAGNAVCILMGVNKCHPQLVADLKQTLHFS